MKITTTLYKGVSAYSVTTKKVTAVFLPTEGGKMASFKENNKEKEYLIQNPSEKFLHMGIGDSYVEKECAGFDDLFPTVDACDVYLQGEKCTYDDHGEICRIPSDVTANADSLVFKTISKRFPFIHEKTVSENSDGELVISYRIKNTSNEILPCMWVAHCLLNAEKGCKVLLPFKNGEKTDIVFDLFDRFNGVKGITDFNSEMAEFSFSENEKECYKLYFPRILNEAKMGVQYPDGKVFSMAYEGLSYVGVWFHNMKFFKKGCIGLEPCSCAYDSVENANGKGLSAKIDAKSELCFKIVMSVYDMGEK